MSISDEELRRRKYEEALEVKSLRRIISAYLNYPEATEEDVKRYERSFRRLSVAHKALLSHLPLKYQKLRRCISKNSFFIFEMLKAFEPPVDMSQGDDICDRLDDGSCGHVHSEDRDPCSCEPASISGRVHSKKSGEVWAGHEEKNENYCEPEAENFAVGLECVKDAHRSGCDSATCVKDQNCCHSLAVSNKDMPSAPVESPDYLESMPHFHVPLVDVDKVRWVIRNIVRDWAAEGQKERDQCYKPILEELRRNFPERSKESPPTCLVPGAGLGRLALEISCLGVNLGAIVRLMPSDKEVTVLSPCRNAGTQDVGEWTIYPWIHSNCNSLSDADQLRAVSIPDIHPAGAGITDGFSMCDGDFVEVYNDPIQVGAWDAVVTCFFLDTAHNIVEYIEIISKILKDGGVWINLGPLLYHFADMYGQEDEMSVELCLEDVKRVAIHYGFELELEKAIETAYTTNPRAMMQNHYFSAFWTMRKKPSVATTMQESMNE